jgi:hypothetical protein
MNIGERLMCESADLLPVIRLHQAGDVGAVFTNWDRLSVIPNDILHSFVAGGRHWLLTNLFTRDSCDALSSERNPSHQSVDCCSVAWRNPVSAALPV